MHLIQAPFLSKLWGAPHSRPDFPNNLDLIIRDLFSFMNNADQLLSWFFILICQSFEATVGVFEKNFIGLTKTI